MLSWSGFQCISEDNLNDHVLKMGKKMMKWFHLYADQGDAIKYTLTDKSRNEIASSVSEKKKIIAKTTEWFE